MNAQAQQILFPGTTWDTATPESVWVDSAKLNTAIRGLPNPQETMVIQNGRVIWQGNNIESQQHVWSVTKTYTSTAMGLLFDDGKLDLDTPVSKFVPSMEDNYADATFGHFVTQTSGYVAADERIPLSSDEPDDPYAPGSPLFSPPGEQFAYTGAAMDMFAYGLAQAAEEPLQDLFTRRIAEPIEMDSDTWDWNGFETTEGVHIDGGSGYENKGIAISAANAARLGLLFLTRGNWNGEQLLSSEWVDLATQIQVPDSVPLHPDSATPGPGVYGLGWWVSPSWFEAIGFQNNYVSVNPYTGTVVVSLGTESGGNGNIDSFKSSLGRATIPAVWDGLGNGNWDDIDAAGVSRWTTEDGSVAAVVPTTDVTIRNDQVTIQEYFRTGDITVENGGGLHIAATSEFRSNGRMKLSGQSNFILEGKTHVSRLDLESGSSLVIGDQLVAGQIDVEDSSVTVHDTGAPIQINSRFKLSGDSTVRLVIADEDWNSTFELKAPRIKPRLAGALQLELTPELDPEQLEGKTINVFDWVEAAKPSSEFVDILHPTRIELDLSGLYTDGDILVTSVLDKPTTAGDFNGDMQLDVSDIDSLSSRVQVHSTDAYYDLNDDQQVNAADLVVLVEDLMGTKIGDTDLDGQVAFPDFLQLSEHFGQAGGWGQGDFDGNGQISFPDFLALSANFAAVTDEIAAVPEPAGIYLAMLSAIGLIRRRRRS